MTRRRAARAPQNAEAVDVANNRNLDVDRHREVAIKINHAGRAWQTLRREIERAVRGVGEAADRREFTVPTVSTIACAKPKRLARPRRSDTRPLFARRTSGRRRHRHDPNRNPIACATTRLVWLARRFDPDELDKWRRSGKRRQAKEAVVHETQDHHAVDHIARLFSRLKWLDGQPLKIEPYRAKIFRDVLDPLAPMDPRSTTKRCSVAKRKFQKVPPRARCLLLHRRSPRHSRQQRGKPSSSERQESAYGWATVALSSSGFCTRENSTAKPLSRWRTTGALPTRTAEPNGRPVEARPQRRRRPTGRRCCIVRRCRRQRQRDHLVAHMALR